MAVAAGALAAASAGRWRAAQRLRRLPGVPPARGAAALSPPPPAIYCVGLNYRRHAAETGLPEPRFPIFFFKPPTSVIGDGDAIAIPSICHPEEVDYEAELAVVIGRAAKNVGVDEALSHVAGYACSNDVSARRWQGKKGGGQWSRSKVFDTFCPIGPVVPASQIPDPDNLAISCTLNGEVVQESSTKDMIFPVAKLISFMSEGTTLLPGTVILTGTPEGVGFTRKPPVFLKPGDSITVAIEKIGELTNPVVKASE